VGCARPAKLHGIIEGNVVGAEDGVDYNLLQKMNQTFHVTVPRGETRATATWVPPATMYAIKTVRPFVRDGSQYGTLELKNPDGTTMFRHDEQPIFDDPSVVGPYFLIDGEHTLSLELPVPHEEDSKWMVLVTHYSLLPDMCPLGPFEWSLCEGGA